MSVDYRPTGSAPKQADGTTTEQLIKENGYLKQQVTGLQLALCEVFERVEALTDAKEDA